MPPSPFMNDFSLFDPSTLRWAFGLIIAFPLALILLGELASILRRNRLPIHDTVRILRNLVLPALGGWLLLSKVINLPESSILVRIALTALWLGLLHTALAFVNDVVFDTAEADSWQARVPKLLLQLVRLVLVIIGFAVILSTVWNQDLTSWLTALGVGSIVIGLALQEPLGNVFAGLMLLFERPVSVGDWIEVEGTRGKVKEINWRSVHVETPTREILVVPNSTLNKGSFRNLSRPSTIRTENLQLGFSYDDPPNKVKDILLNLLRTTPGVLTDPPPLIRTLDYADFSINYLIIFSVESQETLYAIRDHFMTRVWYAVQRHGLTIPFPIQTEIQSTPKEMARPEPDPSQLAHLFPHWFSENALGSPENRKQLAEHLHLREFAAGECILRIGIPANGFYLILQGTAALSTRDPSGKLHEIGQIGPGEYFGEGSIMGSQISDLEVVASDDLEALVLEPDFVQSLLMRLPRLSREIGAVMDQRRQAAQLARRNADPHRPTAHKPRSKPTASRDHAGKPGL